MIKPGPEELLIKRLRTRIEALEADVARFISQRDALLELVDAKNVRIEALEAALQKANKSIYSAMEFAIGSVSGPTTDEEVALMWQWIDEAYAEYTRAALDKDAGK